MPKSTHFSQVNLLKESGAGPSTPTLVLTCIPLEGAVPVTGPDLPGLADTYDGSLRHHNLTLSVPLLTLWRWGAAAVKGLLRIL